MTKIVFKIFKYFLVCSILPAGVISGFENKTQRYALIIGSNEGGQKNQPLRYAREDARKISGVLKKFGGVMDADMIILYDPPAEQLFAALDNFKKKAHNVNSERKSEFIFYFSGHSDEEGIILKNSVVSWENLKKIITSIKSQVQVIILDSCSSGTMTMQKGGKKIRTLLNDESVRLEGMAVITSSSEKESAQESGLIQGAIFTHYFVSGLLGAADVNYNKKITLEEAYQFAFQETLLRSGKTIYGLQHPAYDIQMKGFGNFVLTDISNTSSKLVLDKKIQGRISLHKMNGPPIVELLKQNTQELEIALEPGVYDVFLAYENRVSYGSFSLSENQERILQQEEFKKLTQFEAISMRGQKNNENDIETYNKQKTIIDHLNQKMENIKTTSGAGPALAYGFSPDGAETLHIIMRSASQFGSFFRFGGFGEFFTGISNTNIDFFGSSAGLSSQVLIRLDPLIIAPSLDLGGGILYITDMTPIGFTSIYPHLDFELRILNNINIFASAGYLYLFSNQSQIMNQFSGIPLSLGIYFGFNS